MDRDSIERTLRRIGLPVAAAIVALGIGGVLVATLGQSPLAGHTNPFARRQALHCSAFELAFK